MNTLFLGIFKDCKTQKEVKKLVVSEFQASEAEVEQYQFLVAYVDYDSYEGTGWMLMRKKDTKELFMNHSGHCSCYGNEGQFTPEVAPLAYLKSENFSVYSYGGESVAIKDYINKLKK